MLFVHQHALHNERSPFSVPQDRVILFFLTLSSSWVPLDDQKTSSLTVLSRQTTRPLYSIASPPLSLPCYRLYSGLLSSTWLRRETGGEYPVVRLRMVGLFVVATDQTKAAVCRLRLGILVPPFHRSGAFCTTTPHLPNPCSVMLFYPYYCTTSHLTFPLFFSSQKLEKGNVATYDCVQGRVLAFINGLHVKV